MNKYDNLDKMENFLGKKRYQNEAKIIQDSSLIAI